MFLNNSMHPALAGAGAQSNPTIHNDSKRDAFAFSGASETEDFNAFRDSDHDAGFKKQPRRNPKSSGGGLSKGMIIAIAVAAVVVILLAAIIAFAVTRDKSIKYEDNAYIAFADEDGNYRVAVNGTILDDEFEGDVTVTPSADYSFAYVTDETSEGKNLYVLKGKDLELVTMGPVQDIISYASLKPGAIYVDENGRHCLYSEKVGDISIGKNVTSSMLSGDASTVIYTKLDKNGETDVILLRDDYSEENLGSNCVPVAISNYGDYLYTASINKESGVSSLYFYKTKNQDGIMEEVPNSEGFTGITAINRKGTEIVFTTTNAELKVSSSLFRLKKAETTYLAGVVLGIVPVDPQISIYDSFADTYFSGMLISEKGTAYPTYHLSKKFECVKIANYSGKFSNDGDYFYFINNEGELREMDLTDENRTQAKLFDGVVDFAITEKGNVYALNDENELRFYQRSSNKRPKISDDATGISMYNYGNTVYFSEEGDTDVSVFISKEGSAKEICKFGSTQINNVPYFTHPTSKKTYAVYYDNDTDAMALYYTSNGKRFKLVTQDCGSVVGMEDVTFG